MILSRIRAFWILTETDWIHHSGGQASLVAQLVKNPLAMHETWVQSLGWEDLWRMAWQLTPVFVPGESPWTEVSAGLQSMGSRRDAHDWATKHSGGHWAFFSPPFFLTWRLWSESENYKVVELLSGWIVTEAWKPVVLESTDYLFTNREANIVILSQWDVGDIPLNSQKSALTFRWWFSYPWSWKSWDRIFLYLFVHHCQRKNWIVPTL